MKADKNSRHSKTIRSWLRVSIVAAIMVLLIGVPVAFADGGGGAGGGNDGGNKEDPGCLTGVKNDTNTYGKGTLTQYDSCGAGFQLYDVSDSGAWPRGQSDYINSNVVPVCSKFGGKFYYLSLHRVSLNSSGTGVNYSGKFSHRRQVKNLKSANSGGSGHIPYIAKGGALSFASVLKDHTTAEEYAKQHPEQDFSSFLSTPWTDVTWFCWNPEWAKTDASGFSSKSKVTDGVSTNISSDWAVDDAGTLEVEADSEGKATVYFSHNLKYSNSKPDGKAYGQATTNGKITFDDGSGDTYDVPFSADGASTGVEKGWQTSDSGIAKTITLAEGEDSKTICSTITYTTKTVNWSDDNPHAAQPVGDSGSTKACAKITRAKVEKAGQIEFWSQSRVESVAGKDVKSHSAETIEKTTGDIATLRLSTDWPSAQANFSHKISYEMIGFTVNTDDTVTYDNMCTTWTIESDTSANGKSDKFCASSYYTGESTVSTTSGHTVSISAPGGEASAQEKIKYEKKVVPILREEIKYSCPTLSNPNKKCSYDPKRWKYYAEANTGSGQGDSTAKIIYDRPNEPTGDGPSSGNGGVDGSPMYAGETTSMSWEAQAVPKNTRRVMEFQSISFLSQVSKSLSSANTKGTYQNTIPSGNSYPYREGYNQDPCTFWIYRLGPLRADAGGCAQVTSNSSLNKTFPNGTVSSSEASVGAGETLAVPDWVGDKYCNSFGYKWEYYYGVMNTKGPNAGNWTWTSDNQPYWVHYNAACRTIAKKPSVALWNGGLFVGQGNVKTSTSPRYNNPSVATAASAASDLRRFGSWAEYLANVHGSVGGSIPGVIPGLGGSTGLFSSAAAFAWNGSVESEPIKNSPLTIQNAKVNMLGYSGVDANSAMLDRLEAYFKTAATSSDSNIGNITVPAGSSNIYYVDGSVNITGPITITSSVSSVYQIPQVVIFATGDINISPDVERIDAWLISKNGKVDTCATTNLVDSVTQANVNKSHNPDTRPLRCEKKLVINGPVFAKTVTTDRTFGSDGTANNDEDSNNATNPRAVPAEVFNLSAENYLWAYAQAGRYSSSYTEAYSRELPPRY